MGRKVKRNADYIMVPTNNTEYDTLLNSLNRKWGNDGRWFWTALQSYLGGTEGHLLDFSDEDVREELYARTGVDEAKTEEILRFLVKKGWLDEAAFHQGFLWCQFVVDYFDRLYKYRKISLPENPFAISHDLTAGKTDKSEGNEDFPHFYADNITKLNNTEYNETKTNTTELNLREENLSKENITKENLSKENLTKNSSRENLIALPINQNGLSKEEHENPAEKEKVQETKDAYIEIPLMDGSLYGVEPEYVLDWVMKYPGAEVESAVKQYAQFISGLKGENHITRSNVLDSLGKWLERKLSTPKKPEPPPKKKPVVYSNIYIPPDLLKNREKDPGA